MGIKASQKQIDDLVAGGGKAGPTLGETLTRIEEERAIYRDPPEYAGPGAGQTDIPMPRHLKEGVLGVWTFRIPNWHPAPVNRLYANHWSDRRKHKKTDADIVAYYGRGVPKAVGKRSVSLHVVFPPRKRMPDVDSLWKSLLDSLVHAGLLVNDSAAWASMNPVAYSRGQELVTFITVEDV